LTTSAITSVNDVITRLQRERESALRRIDEPHVHYKKELKSRESDFGRTADKERAERDFAEARPLIETQKSSIKMLQDELGEEAEFDAEETAHMRHVRRECEKRISQYESHMVQVREDMQKEIDKLAELLRRSMKDCHDLRDETSDTQRGAITMFDEQKRYESRIQRLQSDIHRANTAMDKTNTAMDKMRDEAVRLRSKNNDLRDERSRIKQLQEDDDAACQAILADRDSTIENLQSLLKRRNRELERRNQENL